MNILIAYNSALEPHSFNGVQRYYVDVVKEWFRAGHQVDFLVARGAWPSFRRDFPKSHLISSDNLFEFPPERLRQTWRYLPAFAWRMVTPYFVRTPVRYDVVLASSHFIYEAGPALVLARRHRAAMAVKVHHVIAAQSRGGGVFDRLHLWSERTTARWLNRRADVLFCTTRRVAEDWNAIEARLGLTPRGLLSTGTGLNLEELRFDLSTPKAFDAVLLGRVHAHKGLFDAPKVWSAVRRRIPGARLLIVGEGPHRVELEARFAAAGMGPESGAVVFTGGVSDAEKNRLIPQCRVGLSLSREEGWGLSITELMANGLPIVAMDLPVFHEVFPGMLDLTPMGDTDATAERILHWLEHPDEARARGAENHAFAVRYDIRNVAQAELAALEDAVARHRAKTGVR